MNLPLSRLAPVSLLGTPSKVPVPFAPAYAPVPETTVYSPWVGWPARAVPAKRAVIDEPSSNW